MNLISLRLFHHVLTTTILVLGCTCVAQPSQKTAPQQELAVEVDSGVGQPHEFPVWKGGGGGSASFKRIESWRPSVGEARVNDILFQLDREGDTVIVVIAARLENDKEVKVGTYRLGMGETTTTEELAKFGVEPFVMRVVKAKPPFTDPVPPVMPAVENKTKAVEVVGFYKEDLLANTFLLTLRNISTKNIIAIDLFMPNANGNGGGGQRRQGDKKHPVMLPDAISAHHISVSRGGRMTASGFVPEGLSPQTLIVRTVVFDDGTYDGLVEPAAEFEAARRGLEIQRRRILLLLHQPKNADGNLRSPDDLKEAVYALSKDSDESVTNGLLTTFPSLNEKSKPWLLSSVGSGLREGKLEFLRHINEFEEKQKQGRQLAFAEWLKQMRVTYEELISQ